MVRALKEITNIYTYPIPCSKMSAFTVGNVRVWYGLVMSGLVRYVLVMSGLVRYVLERSGMVSNVLIRYGTGMFWYVW